MAEAAVKEDRAAEAEQELTDGFHLIIDALKLNGIETIYGVPGIPITDFGRMAQAAGIRVLSFRHEQSAGYAASIAGFLTKKPGVCLTVSAPGFLNGLTALAHATTNCFPMILISGSSEREIVDLQQGDYEEMDQLAIAKPLCKAAYRMLHAEDIGIGVARAIRAAVSGRPGGVYLDLPAKLFGQVIDAAKGEKSLVKVIDPAPAQIPAPDAVKRALDVLKSAKRPLIILGKGAAYAQADDAITSFVEKTGIPFLPMSMAKGLLPDTHPQCAGAARSTVLKESDVVLLIGARLNWLLSHGKGKAWGEAPKKFIQIDIEPKEMDSNVEIVAPVVGDIGSCVAALLDGHGRQMAGAAGRLDQDRHRQAGCQRRQDGAAAAEQQRADGLSRRARRLAHDRQGAARRHAGQRGRQRARPHPRHHRHLPAAQAHRRRHLGHHGHRHGLRHRRGGRDRQAGAGDRRRLRPSASPAWRSRPSAATRCRSASSSSTMTASIAAPTSIRAAAPTRRTTVFVKGARYDKMIEAFGGVGVNATSPDELKRAVNEAMDSGKPTLINAVIDPAAGSELGRIGNLNPQSKLKKK